LASELLRLENKMKISTLNEIVDSMSTDLSEIYSIHKLLTKKAVAMLYAPEGRHKTFLMMYLLSEMCIHGTFLGRASTIKKVLYVSGEGNIDVPLRLQSLREYHQHDPLLDNFHVILDDSQIDLNKRLDVDIFIERIQSHNEFNDKYDMIVFDTLSAFTASFRESSNDDSKTLKMNLSHMCNSLDCNVFFLHHSPKTKDGEDSSEYRGASGIGGFLDLSIYIAGDFIKCRKVKSGQKFDSIAYGVKPFLESIVAIPDTSTAPMKAKPSIKQAISELLTSQPDISNMQIIRSVFNANAKRYTDKQIEQINEARNELGIHSKRANAKQTELPPIGNVDTDIAVISDFISLNELDNDNDCIDLSDNFVDANNPLDFISEWNNPKPIASTREKLRQLGGVS